MCIVVVRGILVNLGFYFQAKISILGLKDIPNLLDGCKKFPESLVSAGFFAIFGLVIAFMKDVPDVLGDEQFQIKSFSVKLGVGKTFR
jgi:homogentisate phytyltransferase/homogentisate geranylgeranyltransferase